MEKVSAFISLPSLSLYMLSLNFMSELLNLWLSTGAYNVWTSVARPEMPMRHWSLTLKTRWKLVSMVISWVERRVSVAMATQFLPAIATITLPLYWSIDWKQKMRCERYTYHD